MRGIARGAGAVVKSPIGFARGLSYAVRGMRFVYLKHPNLARYWLFPVLITAFALVGVFYGAGSYNEDIGAALWSIFPESWNEVTGWVGGLLSALRWVVEVIAAILITVAGTLYGIQVQLRPVMGWHFLIPLFVAVIMGGIGSFWGAMIGGLIIGVSEEMITGLLQNFVHTLQLDADMSVYKPAVAFVLVVVILLLRPHGIFGKKEA